MYKEGQVYILPFNQQEDKKVLYVHSILEEIYQRLIRIIQLFSKWGIGLVASLVDIQTRPSSDSEAPTINEQTIQSVDKASKS